MREVMVGKWLSKVIFLQPQFCHFQMQLLLHPEHSWLWINIHSPYKRKSMLVSVAPF